MKRLTKTRFVKKYVPARPGRGGQATNDASVCPREGHIALAHEPYDIYEYWTS